ncbi:MAG: hypothetical protein KDB27_03685 [Planctomycetales bacterium]|nr:hypothetical protein [Planctomycetales bacterium]
MHQHQRPTRIRLATAAILWSAVVAATPSVNAQSLLDEDPYDLVTVTDANGPTTLKVLPLTQFKDRRVPATLREPLKVRRLEDPDQEFEVAPSAVKKVELYEQRVLTQALSFTRQKDFDKAFEYLSFLRTRYPKTPGLDEAMQQMLTAEATALYSKREYERAWFLLNEIYSLNPSRPGLDKALTAVLDRMFAKRISDRDFVDARRIHGVAKDRYQRLLQPLLRKWETQLGRYAEQAKTRAEQKLAAKEYADAYRAGQLMMEIWPETNGARQLFAQLATAYPIVTVAVTQPYSPAADKTNCRSTERCQRLLHRSLFEMTDVGSEGGDYICPMGSHRISANGRSIDLDLSSLANAKGNLSGLTVARQLRAMALPQTDKFSTQWRSVFEKANASDLFNVAVSLQRPHLRFEAIVSDSLAGLDSIASAVAPYAPIANDSSDDAGRSELRFRKNPDYLYSVPNQPAEIAEELYTSSESALSALRRGEVDVIARLLPADAIQALRDNTISARPYRVPSMHMLIPNYDDEFVSQRAYRLALLYAIDRETILQRELLGGGELAGCQIVSGPFPYGLSNDDPISYGYNRQIRPRGYDPRLAKVRLQLAKMQADAAAVKAGEESAPTLTKLVLAHPDDEIAKIACQHIANNWRILGFEVETLVLSPGQGKPESGDWHFLYADLHISEPLTDATNLLASSGFVRCGSPYLNLALRQLNAADNWNLAGTRLQAIHQICFDDVSVIPLWQLSDYFAHGPKIDGIGTQPVTLYQNVENWRVIPQ